MERQGEGEVGQQRDAGRARARGHTYGLLRRIFSQEVDPSLLAWCREQERLGLWGDLGPDLAEALAAEDDEALLEELAVEYCRLFITSGAGGSPHESVHAGVSGSRADAPLLFGDPASAMKQLCRKAGFEFEREEQLPDALEVELELMERLCQSEGEAGLQGNGAEVRRLQALQERALREHLARWVPGYGRKLAAQAQSGFYRVMLTLLADFIESEEPGEREA